MPVRSSLNYYRILNIISYLAPEKISRELFLGLTGSNEEELRSAVRLLIKYSMVNGEQKQSVLSVHRLVQEVTRIALEEEGKSEEVMKETYKLLEASFPYNSDRLEDYLKKRALLPHLEVFLSHIDNWLKKNPKDQQRIEEYNAPICLDHFFKSDPIFKMNMLINTSTHI